MEMGEGMAMLVAVLEEKAECAYNSSSEPWQANLEGKSSRLATRLGDKPDASCEAELSSSRWPSQAHHLIPHLTLIKHPVAEFLKSGDCLYGDTYYNVDHKNNGYWMPYASGLPEWVQSPDEEADFESNRALMFKVMRLAQIQLHQGPHSESNRYGIGEAPYKGRVMEYLDKIEENALSHYAGEHPCRDCNGKAEAGKYPPRANIVLFVDKASDCIKADIQECRIFVSQIAADFAKTGGFAPHKD